MASETPVASPVEQLEYECIPSDLPCLFCGYNLRTLVVSAKCPECGKPVSETLKDTLQLADPTWLKRVRRDVSLLILMPVLFLITVTQPYDFWPISWWRWWWGTHLATAFLGPMIWAVHVAVVWHFAQWRQSGKPCGTRYTILLPLVCTAVFFPVLLDYVFETNGLLSELTLTACAATYPALPIIVGGRARALANRASRPGVARYATTSIWIGRATLATMLTAVVLGRLGAWQLIRTSMRWQQAHFLQEVACSIFIPVLGLNLVLMLLLRRVLSRAIRVARARQPSLPESG